METGILPKTKPTNKLKKLKYLRLLKLRELKAFMMKELGFSNSELVKMENAWRNSIGFRITTEGGAGDSTYVGVALVEETDEHYHESGYCFYYLEGRVKSQVCRFNLGFMTFEEWKKAFNLYMKCNLPSLNMTKTQIKKQQDQIIKFNRLENGKTNVSWTFVGGCEEVKKHNR